MITGRMMLGALVEMPMRYRESPDPPPPGVVTPGAENKVMHGSFRIGDSVLMAFEDYRVRAPAPSGFSLSISVADADEAKQLFDALADGRSVQVPLGKTFWSPCFGMLTDRCGVGWVVNAPA